MRSQKKYWKTYWGVLLLCISLLTACGGEEEPEYGYLPSFVSVPDKVFQTMPRYAIAEEGIYTIADTTRNAAVSLYSFETEDKQKIFNSEVQGQAVGLGIGGEENRRLIALFMVYEKAENGDVIYSERSSLLQCYTIEGQLCWEYGIEEESGPEGAYNLFVAPDGMVFVEMSNYLYVFSSEGQLLGQLEYPDGEGYSPGKNEVFACDDAGETYLVRASKAGADAEDSQYKLYSWDMENGTLKEQGAVDGKCPVQTMGERGLYFRDSDKMYQYDPSSGEMTPLFSLTENMISAYKVRNLMRTENGWKVLCMDHYRGSGTQLATLEWGALEQTESLYIGAINTGAYNEEVILFNQQHPEYLVRVRDYSNDDPKDLGLTQLQLSLVNKDAPDLVQIWSREIYLNYGRKGWLEDLTPYVEISENINMEDFIPHVREAMTVEGELYCLPSTFNINTLVAPVSAVGDKSNWTIEEFLEFMEEYPNALSSSNARQEDMSARKVGVLITALQRGLEGFVDSEHGKVDLDNERFRSLLTRINSLQIDGSVGGNDESRIEEGEVLLSEETISSLDAICQWERRYGESVTLIGYPTSERESGGGRLEVFQPLGIVSRSRHKDAAWCYLEETFLRSSAEVGYGFPARQESLEQLIAQEQKPGNDNGNYSDGFDENGNTGNSYLSKRHTDIIWNAINTSVAEDPVLHKIMLIIREEATFYFSGVKSLDEVIEVMESRAEMYFNENR
ncbi:MAG: extracellular solute-binding protein [Acetatifactor sp.]